VAAISAARPTLGRLFVDNSIAALAPNGFAQREVPFLAGDGAAPGEATTSPDAVAFFAESDDAPRLRAIADAAGLTRRYAMPGTQIHLAARQRLEDVPLLADLVGLELHPAADARATRRSQNAAALLFDVGTVDIR
jgi:hypothetical protein